MENLLTLEPELVTNVRRTTLHNREYVVADVTILKEGVLSGSKGPLFYPFEEIARRPGIWNGVPLTNGHPMLNGLPVSGRTPEALNEFGLGHFFGDNIDASSKTRKGQIWIDVQVANRILPDLIPTIEAKKPIDVSTGLFTSDQLADNNATYNGTKYTHIARDHLPDHLAILLKERGACSTKDGCGINVNVSSLSKDLFQDTPDERILGSTQNCPKCGAMLGAGASKCPACGAKISPLLNVFCATGMGGGIDPTCSTGGSGGTSKKPFNPKSHEHRKLIDAHLGNTLGALQAIAKSMGLSDDAYLEHVPFGRSEKLEMADKFEPVKKRALATVIAKKRYESSTNNSLPLFEVPMDRTQLVNWLTTNCACWKGKDEVLKNEKSFTDEDLKTLKANAENSTLAINTLREIGTTLELPKNSTLDDLKGAVTNMFGKSKSKKDDDDDDDDDDEDMKGKKKPAMNQEQLINALKAIPEKDVLEMFPTLKATVNSAGEVVNEKRIEIIRQLTANISDEKEKKTKLLMLKDKTLPQLREFLAFHGTTNTETSKDDTENYLANFFKGNYTGAQGTAPVNNSSTYDKSNILPPTLNLYDDETEEVA